MLKLGSSSLTKCIFASFLRVPATEVKHNGIDWLRQPVRYTGFLNRLTGEQLWKGVTSVSNAGKRKGRGRGKDKRALKNLNFGQKIGTGKIRVAWPGLNTLIIKNKHMQQIKESDEKVEKVEVEPPTIRKKKLNKLHPLDRGWAGKQQRGRRIGPPGPLNGEHFEGFESIVLEHKLTQKMSAVLGRKRMFFSIVATGNSNGLVGLGKARSIDPKTSINLARTRAARRLITIDLIENHTVNHDFFSEYGRTRVFVFKKPEGYGLTCHRIIIALCKLIGIKNLYAKVEGAINPIHIMRAFVVGLLRQKTYQQIADENNLHLVEFRDETNGFPKVLASPEKCLTRKEALRNPVLFEEYIMGGKLVYKKEKKIPFYQKLPSWTTYLKRTLYHRNHNTVKINLLAEYGSYKSHLTEVYPECITTTGVEKKSKETA